MVNDANVKLVVVLACLAAALFIVGTEACSCVPMHPQEHYCKSDYVIIARVLKRLSRPTQGQIGYKIDILKRNKMSEKAEHLLKHGRILTADNNGMCGIELSVGKVYTIAGRTHNVGICDFVKEYSEMSIVERRGFAGSYAKGCPCAIRPCFGNNCHATTGACSWSPFGYCETHLGVCIPSRGLADQSGNPIKCHWRRTRPYTQCRRNP